MTKKTITVMMMNMTKTLRKEVNYGIDDSEDGDDGYDNDDSDED